MSLSSSVALPYQEPDIATILILSSFILALNLVNHILDKLIFCGLLGQVVLGIAWGTPGARWLGIETEKVIVNIGYLGLILLVYEGGLSTNFNSLKANLALSAGIALTGITLPIGLSYVLLKLGDATPLQAFAAGAALCSTSLGTTFTVLGTSGLVTTRMGVVLSSAAMMDDVVGLVMVQVISELGGATSSFSAITVIRPVFVSLAFVVVVPLVARLIVKPLTTVITNWRSRHPRASLESIVTSMKFALIIHTGILLGMIAGSSYAGTSNLFAAYLAGASISWWDSEVPHIPNEKCLKLEGASKQDESKMIRRNVPLHARAQETQGSNLTDMPKLDTSGVAIFEQYYEVSLTQILKPFFFASIGFSIPITKMFTGSIVWRGLIYTMLMFTGKIFCGLWLVRVPVEVITGLIPWKRRYLPRKLDENQTQTIRLATRSTDGKPRTHIASSDNEHEDNGWDMMRDEKSNADTDDVAVNPENTNLHQPVSEASAKHKLSTTDTYDNTFTTSNPQTKLKSTKNEQTTHDQSAPKPRSLYPSLILGTAMTARGEIGFLISSVAQSKGIFSRSSSSDIDTDTSDVASPLFLIVTWAIVLCTVFGPICVGVLVRRVKRLERKDRELGDGSGTSRDVLGVWGVSSYNRS